VGVGTGRFGCAGTAPTWTVETAEGPASVRFSERNSYGVLDHAVRMPRGISVYVPAARPWTGCELVLTLLRRPDRVGRRFAADAEWVMRDLLAAKRILER
jgi:hypothetical protein